MKTFARFGIGKVFCKIFLALFFLSLSAATIASTARFLEFVEQGDYLGARVFLKKNLGKISTTSEWLVFRAELMKHADLVGFDLVYAIDKKGFEGIAGGAPDLNASRNNADQLMLSGQFEEAFKIYQRIAQELKRIHKSTNQRSAQVGIEFLQPYIYQSMARALYGARRYDESFLVYRWIPNHFSRIREVQFEKMWAAFRGGRIDQALGAIASQSSSYFSVYLPAESYLVQTYLYKRLCRDTDFNMVLRQMRDLRDRLKGSAFSLEEYVKGDLETLVLWRVSETPKGFSGSGVSVAERETERQRILKVLSKAYIGNKTKLFDDLEKALAYVQLTVRAGSSGVLKPIEKMPSRQAFFDLGLEIWPADSREDWIDEIGSHRFMGESLCKKEK